MATSPSQGDEAPTASNGSPPTTLSVAESEQVAALMTLIDHLTPVAKKEFHRQLREQDNTSTTLFKLPAELRNCIFEMAFLDILVSSEAQKITVDPCTYTEKEPTTETHQELKALISGPKAMNACRQMRQECRSLLGLNKIVMTRYTSSSESHITVSPMRLDEEFLKAREDFPKGGRWFLWVYLHDSEDIAREIAREWSKDNRGSGVRDVGGGTVSFPSTPGIKPRSIIITYCEDGDNRNRIVVPEEMKKHLLKFRDTAS